MYVCTHVCMCMLCVALAHMCVLWYNRSAVHLGHGWPNSVAQAGQVVKRKAWDPHNLHNSSTHPTTVGNCVGCVETLHILSFSHIAGLCSCIIKMSEGHTQKGQDNDLLRALRHHLRRLPALPSFRLPSVWGGRPRAGFFLLRLRPFRFSARLPLPAGVRGPRTRVRLRCLGAVNGWRPVNTKAPQKWGFFIRSVG